MKLAFFFRKYHKWLALIVGLQALIWSISGLYMTAVSIDIIHGDHLVKKTERLNLSKQPIQPLSSEFLNSLNGIKSIRLRAANGVPHYLIRTKDDNIQLNAISHEPMQQPDAQQVRAIANKIYAGDSAIANIELLSQYPSELGGRKQPIWRVEYDDWLNSTLYFRPDTGALRGKRTDLWRWFDFLWMLHIMDYDTREDINNNLLKVAASLGLLMTLAGLGLLTYSFGKNVSQNSSGTLALIKKVHKWISLLIGLQLMLWMLSGLAFSLLSHKEVSGRYLLNKSSPVMWTATQNDFSELLTRYPDVQAIDSYSLLSRPVYRIRTLKESFIVDTDSLKKIDLTESVAKELAETYYAGDGEIKDLQKESDTTLENRKLPKPLWRVNFVDDENSSLYLNASTGQVYAVRTDTWRLFDIFWMLHIMDYSERNDMNNALVIFIALFTSFIAISGIWLLFLVFSLNDFKFFSSLKRVPLLISNKQDAAIEIFVKKNSRLFEALANDGYQLPSTCGGGGSCGLCKVQVDSSLPVSSADKAQLTESELNSGYRLACQLYMTSGLSVELPDQVIQQQLLSCRVISNKFKTPFIKELVLQVPDGIDFQFNAGEYVLLHIPAGEVKLEQVELDEKISPYWENSNVKRFSSHRTEPITRSYSMANPPVQNKQIVLNVRLALPSDGVGESGKASSYLFSLKNNAKVNISGPFGHFHAVESGNSDDKREMVFIGGGVGMAPLRSHIVHQLETLKSKRKISFWYGARNKNEIYYQKIFDQLEKKHENFDWQIALSDKQLSSDWKGFNGMIHQVIKQQYLQNHTNINSCDFYICGPSLMNNAVLSMLSQLGVKQERIHIDDFGN